METGASGRGDLSLASFALVQKRRLVCDVRAALFGPGCFRGLAERFICRGPFTTGFSHLIFSAAPILSNGQRHSVIATPPREWAERFYEVKCWTESPWRPLRGAGRTRSVGRGHPCLFQAASLGFLRDKQGSARRRRDLPRRRFKKKKRPNGPAPAAASPPRLEPADGTF